MDLIPVVSSAGKNRTNISKGIFFRVVSMKCDSADVGSLTLGV